MNLLFFLLFHIIGLALMFGTAVIDMFCYIQFWKRYPQDKARSAGILPVLSSFRFIFAIGFILLLLSGIGMVVLSHGGFAQQLWFRVKMGIVVLIMLNGAIIGRRVAMKLRKIIEADLAGANVEQSKMSLKMRLRMIQFFQLFLFLCIFVLSVYKFN